MLFDFNEAHRNSLQTFVEMGIAEPPFIERTKQLVPAIIEELGDRIPAFRAARGKDVAARKLWIDAWLLLYHLRQQCSMNANGFMSEEKALVIEAFANAFLDFVGRDLE